MSEPINDGGPAFPLAPDRWTDHEGVRHMSQEPGMSLRDWFAGQALSALLQHQGLHDAIEARQLSSADVAGGCFEWADAMIAARDGAK